MARRWRLWRREEAARGRRLTRRRKGAVRWRRLRQGREGGGSPEAAKEPKLRMSIWRVVSTVPGKEGLSPRRKDALIGSEWLSVVTEDSVRFQAKFGHHAIVYKARRLGS